MATSPTQRTLAWCKKRNFVAAIVERWNQYAKIRQDLYGWIDLVAMDLESRTITGIQVTSTSNMSSRITKIREEPRAQQWGECGGRIEIHGWSKRKPRGQKVARWRLRRVVLRADGEVLSDEVEI